MVSDKQITKNGNLLLLLEDPTGQRRVLVNKNKPALFRESQSSLFIKINRNWLGWSNSIDMQIGRM